MYTNFHSLFLRRERDGTTPHQCRYCARYFSTPIRLKDHEKAHEGKGYRCKICNNHVVHSSSLRRHFTVYHSASTELSLQEYIDIYCEVSIKDTEAHDSSKNDTDVLAVVPNSKPKGVNKVLSTSQNGKENGDMQNAVGSKENADMPVFSRNEQTDLGMDLELKRSTATLDEIVNEK